MSTQDHSLEILREQAPEELGRQRAYIFMEAIVELERSLNSMGLSLNNPPEALPAQQQAAETYHQAVENNLGVYPAQAPVSPETQAQVISLSDQRDLDNKDRIRRDIDLAYGNPLYDQKAA